MHRTGEGARWLMLALLLAGAATTSCGSVTKAAAQDPQRCERDPKCKGHQDKSADCVTACVDDPACIDRCTQVTGQFH
jgi:hypothetical protein